MRPNSKRAVYLITRDIRLNSRLENLGPGTTDSSVPETHEPEVQENLQ